MSVALLAIAACLQGQTQDFAPSPADFLERLEQFYRLDRPVRFDVDDAMVNDMRTPAPYEPLVKELLAPGGVRHTSVENPRRIHVHPVFGSLAEFGHPATVQVQGPHQITVTNPQGVFIIDVQRRSAICAGLTGPASLAGAARETPTWMPSLARERLHPIESASVRRRDDGMLVASAPSTGNQIVVDPSDWTVVAWVEATGPGRRAESYVLDWHAASPFAARFPRRLLTLAVGVEKPGEPAFPSLFIFSEPAPSDKTAERDYLWWTHAERAAEMDGTTIARPEESPRADGPVLVQRSATAAGAQAVPVPARRNADEPVTPPPARGASTWLIVGGVVAVLAGVLVWFRRRAGA